MAFAPAVHTDIPIWASIFLLLYFLLFNIQNSLPYIPLNTVVMCDAYIKFYLCPQNLI